MKKTIIIIFSTIALSSCMEKKIEKQTSEKKVTDTTREDNISMECNEDIARYSCLFNNCILYQDCDEKLYSVKNDTIIGYILYNDDKTKAEVFSSERACVILDKIEENIFEEKGGYYRLETKNGHHLFYKNELIFTKK